MVEITNKIGKGFRWAKREHVWETRTNAVLIIGVVTIWAAYHTGVFPAEFGLFFITLATVVHGYARLCHKMEQHYLRGMRHPKKEK